MNFNLNTNKNLIPIAIIVAGVLIASVYLYINQFSGLSAQAAAAKAISFINQNIEAGATAVLTEVSAENNVYKISLKINETPYISYITKDGRFLFPTGIDLVAAASQASTKQSATATTSASAAFARCLTQKGVKFYGAWWCPNCQNQKDKFGDAMQYVTYIECEKKPGTSQGDVTDACKAAKITSYPTWIFADGTEKTGDLPLETLSALSGCSLK